VSCTTTKNIANPTTERKVPASRATARLAELCAGTEPPGHGSSVPSVARGTAKPDNDVDVHYQLERDRRLGWAIEQLAHELAVHRQSGWPRKTT
jgi:hypothetical protein